MKPGMPALMIATLGAAAVPVGVTHTKITIDVDAISGKVSADAYETPSAKD